MVHTSLCSLASPIRCLGTVLLTGLMSLSGGAHAADEAVGDTKEAATEFKPQLWLDSGFWSHHTKQNSGKPYREHNAGLGVEWHVREGLGHGIDAEGQWLAGHFMAQALGQHV